MGLFDNFMRRGFDESGKPEGDREPSRRIPEESVPAPQPSHSFSGTITRNSSNMLIFSPNSYDDVQTIIDHLKAGESVILNLRDVKRDSAQRILDFISGAIYALSGSIYPIENGLFALTPDGVNIMTKNK